MKGAATRTRSGPRVAVEFESTAEATRFLSDLVQLTLIDGYGFDESNPVTIQFRLAVVEAITNVHRHAYGKGEKGPISLEIHREGDSLVAVLRDRGAPFDPSKAGLGKMPSPDELAEGGYGLAILAQVMDELRHRRDGEENELILVKKMWA